MNHPSPSAGQNLCRSCGLCCDGSLFFFTPIGDCKKDDKNQGNIHSRKEEVLPQPCVHHGMEKGCSIYATRPNVCRKFKCQLLRDVEENKSTIEEAMRVVEQLNVLRTRLLATVRTHVGHVETEPLFV
ncbi:MAG: YkgJ family cysteine cluster protein [Verrucomicrobia bacterium]|nr:YkgJ family cysteine cluster protein [Verrucomicrobiota bacterium]